MKDENKDGRILSLAKSDSAAVRFLFCLVAALAAVLIFFASRIAVDALFEIVVRSRHSASDETMSRVAEKYSSMTDIFGNVIALSAIVAVIAKLRRDPVKFLKVAPFSLASLIPVVLFGLFFNFFSESLISLIPFSEEYLSQFVKTYSFLGAGNIVLEVVSVVIVTPVVEETVFRGVSYGALRRGCPRVAATILSAAIFGAAHGNLISFVYTFVLGIALAVCYEASGSIFVPILMHLSFNGASYAASAVMSGFSGAALAAAVAVCGALSAVSLYFILRPYMKKRKIIAADAATEK